MMAKRWSTKSIDNKANAEHSWQILTVDSRGPQQIHCVVLEFCTEFSGRTTEERLKIIIRVRVY
jgi:hypothetical protein